ncbi:hypothetical protein FB567DRAFT_354675 [Paraphoma chrysanthemicola]|uniref:Cytochrome P450 n=1 Tax=Paraphoma chrysanthemicola TaxID=798071 RepID=A0A8K0R906_9PLEO|nr:hypothetical protein FB567DRAFT_354675 [Paraphoma chrysanthemicola]
MASLRTLFLGVHASNRAIRVLFLPVCYVLLLTPFLTLAGYYFGLGQKLSAHVPEDFSWFDLIPQAALSAVFLLLPTRLFSARSDVGPSKDGGKRRVQSLPYWIPGVRHFWSIGFGGERWLKGVRDSAIDGIVAYKAFGAKHNVVLTETLTEESLLAQIDKSQSLLESSQTSKSAVLHNAFGISNKDEPQMFELESTVERVLAAEIYEEAKEKLTSSTLSLLSETLPDFVTFNSSIVDQMQWERVAEVELTDGTSEAECNFFALVNEFCCNAILPPIMGLQFTESNQLLASDLATFNSRYWALALGVPRLSPLPGLPGAALAQKRLLSNFTKLFKELTNPQVRRVPEDDESVSGEETDADVPTPITILNEVFVKHDVSFAARAGITLQIVHGIAAEVIPLVFWTILHVYSASAKSSDGIVHKSPVDQIKQESKTWAQAYQPASIHPLFPAPPEIKFGAPSQAFKKTSMPYITSCIYEARRLYSTSVATFQVKKSITLQEAGARPNEKESWELDVGSYIDVGLSQSVINSSPTVFPDPSVYKPDRFLNKHNVASIVSPSNKSEPFKTALIVSIVTGIIQLWDIGPAPKKSFFDHMQEAREEAQIGAAALSGEQKAARSSQVKEKQDKERKTGKWVLPAAVDGSSVKIPKGDVRVRIRRVEGLPGPAAGRR